MTEIQPVITADTREQAPLDIRAYPAETATLPVGDYGIKGFGDWNYPKFILERKTIEELVLSLTHDRARFLRNILRLRQFEFGALLIEFYESDIESGDYRREGKPNAILQSMEAYQVHCNLHVVWYGNADGTARALGSLGSFAVPSRRNSEGEARSSARIRGC